MVDFAVGVHVVLVVAVVAKIDQAASEPAACPISKQVVGSATDEICKIA
jgi:hypothetical protein